MSRLPRELGPFLLEEQIGTGAMGQVFRARYQKTGQILAVKLLAPDYLEDKKMIARFQRELEILKRLKHPRIVRYYGGGRLGAQRFFAMELVKGGTLASLLLQQGRLSWEAAARYVGQVCEALQHAHDQGVIHRDLKPANILLDSRQDAKLTDFGLARGVQDQSLTVAGRTVGTYFYMAPEQITGSSEISPQTDLYAMGITLFELLTGQTPFYKGLAVDVLTQHLQAIPPPLTARNVDAPEGLQQLLDRLLAKDPQDRPKSALAVTRVLKHLLGEPQPEVRVDTAVPRPAPKPAWYRPQTRAWERAQKQAAQPTEPVHSETLRPWWSRLVGQLFRLFRVTDEATRGSHKI